MDATTIDAGVVMREPPLEALVSVIDWTDLLLPLHPDSSSDSSSSSSSSRLTCLSKTLRACLGRHGTGIVAIRNVPGFVLAKEKLFGQVHRLVHLPADYLEDALTDPQSLYNAGWSFGKEQLGKHKPPDTSKGSFYYNPLTDTPGYGKPNTNTNDTNSSNLRRLYPLAYPRNKWPSEELMPEFRSAACALGNILHQAVLALIPHVDALTATDTEAEDSTNNHQLLYNCIKDSDKVKARLLYYFPQTTNSSSSTEDSWNSWHNDSGFFTALAGEWYVDHTSGHVVSDPARLDPASGLYVATTTTTTTTQQEEDGETQTQTTTTTNTLHVTIPPDCLAIQMGECTQIVTGGIIKATPHCVRGPSSSSSSHHPYAHHHHLARISLAVFVDATPAFPLVAPAHSMIHHNPNDAVDLQPQQPQHSVKVPPLADRWTPGMTFGDFLTATFQKYYEWTTTTSS